ncbi:MAG: class II aldolase/adducin family protein [Bryobacterales bacterium]|nr:class II aldolase/adducin family protein [Bryobacterales bacterium]
MSAESELRAELVKACRVLYACGAAGDGLGGHLSARLGERILIKPRPVSWWRLTPEDLIVLDLDGKRVDRPGEPSGVKEWPIHGRIYAARTDAGCVFHAHPAASTLMAALGITVEPLDQDCAALTDRLPVLDNGAVSIATPALGDQVARALGSLGTLLLKHHGCVVVGESVAEVGVGAHQLERVAKTMLRAAQLGGLPVLSPAQKAAILAARKGAESGSMNQERWRMLQDYYLDRAHD